MAKYRALVGLNYAPKIGANEVRVEAGEVVALPLGIAKTFLALTPPAIEAVQGDATEPEGETDDDTAR